MPMLIVTQPASVDDVVLESRDQVFGLLPADAYIGRPWESSNRDSWRQQLVDVAEVSAPARDGIADGDDLVARPQLQFLRAIGRSGPEDRNHARRTTWRD